MILIIQETSSGVDWSPKYWPPRTETGEKRCDDEALTILIILEMMIVLFTLAMIQ